MWRLVLLGALSAGFVACMQPATEVLVDLGSDIPASDGLLMVVSVGRGSIISDAEARRFDRTLGSDAGLTFPSSFAIVPAAGEPHDDSLTLVIDLTTTPASLGEPVLVLRRTARFAFTPGRTTHLPIFLSRTCGQPAMGCTSVPDTECTLSQYCEDHGATCGDRGLCASTTSCTTGGFDGAFGMMCDGGSSPDVASADVAPEVGIDACTPMCSGRVCGGNGCGGSCGSCPSGESCNSSGACVCVPNCGGRSCGGDGCGGSCGRCPSGDTCSSGHCVCVGSCSGRQCGPNSCGAGSCGTCGTNMNCNGSGQCVCSTLQCGSTCCGSGVLYCGHTDPASCCYTCGGTNCPLC